MKKIGLIGGLGPESTIDYYRGIIEYFKNSYAETGNPEICIESLDLKNFLQLAEINDWSSIGTKLSAVCTKLLNSGAEFGAIMSNTPHKVFEQIQKNTALPLISIVDTTAEHIKTLRLDTVSVLGTQFTMSSDFYHKSLAKFGIKAVSPTLCEQEFIHNKIFSEIEFGIIKKETKKFFIDIINRLEADEKSQGIILACTELPMLLKKEDFSQKYINATQLHIDAIVKRCMTG